MQIELEGVVSAHMHTAPVKEIYPGVRRRDLWRDASGAKAMMVEIDPGAAFIELDVHQPGPEEVFVVSGIFCDGVHAYPAGTFIHHPVGTSHVPQSVDGCVLFVFYPQG